MNIVHKPVSYGEIPEHWVDFEESPRRVRVTFGGETLADTKHAMLLREAGCVPVYYFPEEDVRTDLMQPTHHKTLCPHKGEASYWSVAVGANRVENGVWSYLHPLPEASPIKGYRSFYWNKMDHWYEEEEEVFVHARDPYKRVDVLRGSRHVRVVLGGETVAESRSPRLVIETGHLLRYYLPRQDVRMDLLEPSSTTSRCPYKGKAVYWTAKIAGETYEDTVWSYEEPVPECPKIKDLMCFFNENVDALYVDGEQQVVPKTKWSRR